MKNDVTTEDLHALADDELCDEDRRIIMRVVMRSPALLKELDDILQQKKKVRNFWDSDENRLEH